MIEYPKTKGSYILVTKLMCEIQLNIGALGLTKFSPGLYLYCGSAHGPGGLNARINHHLRPSPRPTWHFDYLKPCIAIEEIWFMETREPYECRFVKILAKMKDFKYPVYGFGSQDCHSGCISHLVYFPLNIKVERIFQLVKEEVAGLMRAELIGTSHN